MLECTLATSGMRDGVSSNVASVTTKMKCVTARSTSKSTATRTQLSSLSLTATLQTMVSTTLRGL